MCSWHVSPPSSFIFMSYCLTSLAFDSDSDDGMTDAPTLRGLKRPYSDTTPAATNTIENHAETPKNALENAPKPTKASERSVTLSTSAIVPCRNATSEEESSKIQRESRPSIQTKSHDKPDTLVPGNPKRRRCEATVTAEAANKLEQPLNVAEPSTAQSSPPPMPLAVSPNPDGQSSAMHESPLPSTPGMAIDAKKQKNTTLWISVPSSSDAVPLKLRSCMTVSSLFDSALTICGLADKQAKVSGLRTRFGWKQNVDLNKFLMLKREFPDSFEIFLEIINKLPCWGEEDGHCVVTVEVVLA